MKHLFLGLFILIVQVVISQNKRIDSLYQVLNNTETKKGRIDIYDQLATSLYAVGPENIILISDSILQLSKDINYEIGIAKSHYHKGKAQHAYGYFDKSIESSKKAKKIFEEHGDLRGSYRSTQSIANSLYYKGNYYQTYLYDKMILELTKDIGDPNEIATASTNLGMTYFSLEHYDEALFYYNEALTAALKANNGYEISRAKRRLSEYYLQLKEYTKAHKLSNEALNYSIAQNHYMTQLYSYAQIGSLYYEQEKYQQAINTFSKLTSRFKTADDKDDKAQVYNKLAKSFYKVQQIDSALFYAKKGYRVSKAIGLNEEIYLSANILDMCYNRLKKYDTAYKYSKIKETYRDSLVLGEKQKEFYKGQIDFELKQFANKKDEEANILKLKRNRLTAFIAVSAIILFLLILYVFKANSNKTLFKEKIKVEKALKEKLVLEKKMAQIEDTLAADLHDNFGNRLGGLLAAFEIVKELNEKKDYESNDFKKFSAVLEKSLYQFSNDIKDLLWANNSKNNFLSFVIDRIRDVAEDFSKNNNVTVKVNDHNSGSNVELPKLANRQLILIIKESINNAIKYSKSKLIDVNIATNKNNVIEINCIDYGIGFKFNDLTRVNGLKNMEKRAESIGFKLKIDSKPEIGTTISLNNSNSYVITANN